MNKSVFVALVLLTAGGASASAQSGPSPQEQMACRSDAGKFCAEHVGKPFYQPLVEFMLSGPVVSLVAEGHRVIEGFRLLAGATDPTSAAPGTIRGDLARDWGLRVQQNLVHGSDSAESAAREVALWFPGS